MWEFPEPLFECAWVTGKRICLVCGSNKAETCLRTDKEVVPLCNGCSKDWNFHGYYILQRLTPFQLCKKLTWYKLTHPFEASWGTIISDLKGYSEWAKKMKKYLKK